MKFLIDVCIGKTVGQFLAEKGYEVKNVNDSDPCMPDEIILKLARSEGRVLITLDKDFGKLIFLHKQSYSGIIRLPNVPTNVRLTLVRDVLDKFEKDLEDGAIITVKSDKIRIRRKQ